MSIARQRILDEIRAKLRLPGHVTDAEIEKCRGSFTWAAAELRLAWADFFKAVKNIGV